MVAEQIEFIRNALDSAIGTTDEELGAKWDAQILFYQMAMNVKVLIYQIIYVTRGTTTLDT